MKAVMLQGTGSDVGKSVLVAGLCRLAANRGIAVRPFKPQNMSNNAAVTEDGGEIGRAQWLQALACRVPPVSDMNPVLLKPQSETGSQIIVNGKVWGQARGRDYQIVKPHLLDAVLEAYRRLCAESDLVIVEGAGSPAEINLRAGDIANMGFARRAGVPVVLVGDIDRGGVIASLAGTGHILAPEDRAMVAGYIVNKFRGDPELFHDGLDAIGRFTGWPCFGVVPWLAEAARLPAEDSVVLERAMPSRDAALKVAVPTLSRIANFDDLDPLKAEPDVEVVFVRAGDRLPADARLIVIPGSKSTVSDLADFRANGWERDIADHVRRGGRVVGICGGYQMMGRSVSDPHGLEGPPRTVEGLGLLAVDTAMEPEKTVRRPDARSAVYDVAMEGYEIHLGRTDGPDCSRPCVTIDGRPDGAVSPDGRITGTYLHGLFSSDAFRRAYLRELGVETGGASYVDGVDRALDAIAETLGRHLDIDRIFDPARPEPGEAAQLTR